MIRWSFILLAIFTATGAFAQIDGDVLFDDGFLHEIRFTSVDTVDYITYKRYQSVNMEVDGNVVANIGFKRKGNISGYPSTNKFPIKIKTNKYVPGQEYDGIREFMLHMNYQDPTMLREKLTYDICAAMGLYSLRTAFAKVYLDNVYWGLYTIVEGKDEMYKQVFNNRDADAMESTEFGGMCYSGPNISDYYYAITPNFGFDIYEHDNGDYNRAWSRFITALNRLNNTPDNFYLDTVSKYFNLEDFFTYQAVNVYLLNMDSYIGFVGNQRYVYDTTENRWQVTPWDFNASFGLWNTNNTTVTTFPMLPSFTCFGAKRDNINELKTYYLDAMCRLSNTVCDTTVMYAEIDRLKLQIQNAVYTDTRKVVTNQDFDRGIEFGYYQLFGDNQPALKTVLRERYRLITAELNTEGYTCQNVLRVDHVTNAEQTFTLFPNPTQNTLTIKAEWLQNTPFTVHITNLIGQQVQTGQTNNRSIDVSGLSNGVYLFTIETEDARLIKKFVKQ